MVVKVTTYNGRKKIFYDNVLNLRYLSPAELKKMGYSPEYENYNYYLLELPNGETATFSEVDSVIEVWK